MIVGGLVGLFVVVGLLVVVVGGGVVGLLLIVALCVGLKAINGCRVVVVCLALGPPLTFVLINENQNIEVSKHQKH